MKRLSIKQGSIQIYFLLFIVLFFLGCACNDGENESDDSDPESFDGDDDSLDDDVGDDDVDDDDGGDDDSADECEGNNAPDLTNMVYWVNGVLTEPPLDVTTLDRIELGIEYSDIECNFGRNSWVMVSGHGGGYFGINDIFPMVLAPCSTKPDEPFRFYAHPALLAIYVQDFDDPYISMADECDESQHIPLDMNIRYKTRECDGNTAPVLLDAEVTANGEPVELPGTIGSDDVLVIYIEYEDAECNLHGGDYVLIRGSRRYSHSYFWILGTGCSSAVDGAYGLFFKANAFSTEESISLRVSDICGAESNEIPIPLTVAN